MNDRGDVLVLGIGNVLWADEGFGVRAVEALHEAWVFPPAVRLMDGGTLGLNLFDDVAGARHVLVFDAIDCALPPGTLTVLRDADVPAWGARRISPHQNGFNDVLALAQLRGHAPEHVTAMPRPVLKTIKVRDAGDLAQLDRYKAAAFLLDSAARWSEGEARRPISWTLAREANARGRVILAAGLTPETVGEAIRVARPWGVDVSSGVEAAPGRKDPAKVARFVRAARAAAAELDGDAERRDG